MIFCTTPHPTIGAVVIGYDTGSTGREGVHLNVQNVIFLLLSSNLIPPNSQSVHTAVTVATSSWPHPLLYRVFSFIKIGLWCPNVSSFISTFSILAPAWRKKSSSLPCKVLPFYFPFDKLLTDKTQDSFQGMYETISWITCYCGSLILLLSNDKRKIIIHSSSTIQNRMMDDWSIPESVDVSIWFWLKKISV